MEDKALLLIFKNFNEAITALQKQDQVRRKEMEACQDRVKTLEDELRVLRKQHPQ